MNKKTTKKKAAPKKSAKKSTIVTKPLERFEGWTINRKGKTVSFGCGEAKVRKSDLIAVAKLKENKEYREAMAAFNRLAAAAQDTSYYSKEQLERLSPQTLLRIAGN